MPKTFWMVKGFGPTSYTHSTYESAELEAKRLAAEFPEETFYVLEAVSAHKKFDVVSWELSSRGEMSPKNLDKEYGIPW